MKFDSNSDSNSNGNSDSDSGSGSDMNVRLALQQTVGEKCLNLNTVYSTCFSSFNDDNKSVIIVMTIEVRWQKNEFIF
jgi:hypothetical protein